MENAKTPTLRALRDLGLVAAASLAAASIWATGLPEEGLLLDATMWQEEVAAPSNRHWPADGWFRLVQQGRGIEVSAARPGPSEAPAADALYFRLPGTQLKPGLRASYTGTALQRPRLGQDYELALGPTRFSVRVESGAKGMQYAIGYGQRSYTYVLGPFDAVSTSVRAVADLDGDALPDFLIDVGEEATYLLLSTRARPGANLPTAELWAKGC
jgi:hypothetical protein